MVKYGQVDQKLVDVDVDDPTEMTGMLTEGMTGATMLMISPAATENKIK